MTDTAGATITAETVISLGYTTVKMRDSKPVCYTCVVRGLKMCQYIRCCSDDFMITDSNSIGLKPLKDYIKMLNIHE